MGCPFYRGKSISAHSTSFAGPALSRSSPFSFWFLLQLSFGSLVPSMEMRPGTLPEDPTPVPAAACSMTNGIRLTSPILRKWGVPQQAGVFLIMTGISFLVEILYGVRDKKWFATSSAPLEPASGWDPAGRLGWIPDADCPETGRRALTTHPSDPPRPTWCSLTSTEGPTDQFFMGDNVTVASTSCSCPSRNTVLGQCSVYAYYHAIKTNQEMLQTTNRKSER